MLPMCEKRVRTHTCITVASPPGDAALGVADEGLSCRGPCYRRQARAREGRQPHSSIVLRGRLRLLLILALQLHLWSPGEPHGRSGRLRAAGWGGAGTSQGPHPSSPLAAAPTEPMATRGRAVKALLGLHNPDKTANLGLMACRYKLGEKAQVWGGPASCLGSAPSGPDGERETGPDLGRCGFGAWVV